MINFTNFSVILTNFLAISLKFRENQLCICHSLHLNQFCLCACAITKFHKNRTPDHRLGRNKIPYHLGNYSFPCGFAARERIISLVVRNFIPTRAIGQESYSSKVSIVMCTLTKKVAKIISSKCFYSSEYVLWRKKWQLVSIVSTPLLYVFWRKKWQV